MYSYFFICIFFHFDLNKCNQICTAISTIFTIFMKAIFRGSDTHPDQVGDMDPGPVKWSNLSDLIGWIQQIS